MSFAASLLNGACASTSPDAVVPDQTAWGSDQAALTIDQNQTTLRIMASGGCYGSYGEVAHGVFSSGTVTLSGTYTELTGVFPGSRQYDAAFTVTVSANQMIVSVAVPDLQRTVGPFTLAAGVRTMWPACRFP
jgi:hypothetical protein